MNLSCTLISDFFPIIVAAFTNFFSWHFCCFLKWAVITNSEEVPILERPGCCIVGWSHSTSSELLSRVVPCMGDGSYRGTLLSTKAQGTKAHLAGGQSRVQTWVLQWWVASWLGSGNSPITLKLSMGVLFLSLFGHLWTQLQLQGAHGPARPPYSHRPPKYLICLSRKSTLD